MIIAPLFLIFDAVFEYPLDKILLEIALHKGDILRNT